MSHGYFFVLAALQLLFILLQWEKKFFLPSYSSLPVVQRPYYYPPLPATVNNNNRLLRSSSSSSSYPSSELPRYPPSNNHSKSLSTSTASERLREDDEDKKANGEKGLRRNWDLNRVSVHPTPGATPQDEEGILGIQKSLGMLGEDNAGEEATTMAGGGGRGGPSFWYQGGLRLKAIMLGERKDWENNIEAGLEKSDDQEEDRGIRSSSASGSMVNFSMETSVSVCNECRFTREAGIVFCGRC